MTFNPAIPAWVERCPGLVNGRRTERLLFIFRARGCLWARQPHRGCSNCGFHPLTTQGVEVSVDDLLAQFASLADRPDAFAGVGQVELFNSGSFFCDEEMPETARLKVLRRLAPTSVERVLVESRPEFLTEERLAAARTALGNKQFEIGIGLEAQDDYIRETLINKGFGKPAFERALSLFPAFDIRLLCYVLLKPIGLTEREAIEEAVKTAVYAFDVAAKLGVAAKVALQPTFVARDTKLDALFQAGQYRPPSLWSVIEVVQRIHARGEVSVGMSDEGLEPHRLPSGCECCSPRLREAILHYNETRSLQVFDGLDCVCRHAPT